MVGLRKTTKNSIVVSADIQVGRDSSVGIATRYLLDSAGFETRWRRDPPHPSGPTQSSIQRVPGLFPGGKAAEVALTTHSHLAPRLKKE